MMEDCGNEELDDGSKNDLNDKTKHVKMMKKGKNQKNTENEYMIHRDINKNET